MAKNTSDSKSTRAAEARRQAQAQVKAGERRTALMVSLGALVAILIFGGLVYFIVQQSRVPDIGEMTGPAGADETGGIVVGTSGLPGQDVPEDAPRVDVYADFKCPACAQFEAINGVDLDELREEGVIQLYFHPVSILDHQSGGTNYSTRAANAAATVADRAPEAFTDFYLAMFVNQPSQLGLSDEQIATIARDSGVPEDVVEVLDDGIFTTWVIAGTERASQDGMTGTPTVMIDREILQHAEVPYTQQGVLREYLESL